MHAHYAHAKKFKMFYKKIGREDSHSMILYFLKLTIDIELIRIIRSSDTKTKQFMKPDEKQNKINSIKTFLIHFFL